MYKLKAEIMSAILKHSMNDTLHSALNREIRVLISEHCPTMPTTKGDLINAIEDLHEGEIRIDGAIPLAIQGTLQDLGIWDNAVWGYAYYPDYEHGGATRPQLINLIQIYIQKRGENE